MLKIDLSIIARKKGYPDVSALLIKRGYHPNKAWRIATGKMKKWDLADIEKICEIFRCTPNELFVLIPDKGKKYDDGNELTLLMRPHDHFDLFGLLRAQPSRRVKELEEAMMEYMKKFS